MATAASTTENKLAKKEPLVELGAAIADKPQESEKSKPKAGNQTVKQDQTKEKKVKPRTNTVPTRNSNKKGRVKSPNKILGQGRNHNRRPKRPAKKSAWTRKENARYRRKKKTLLNPYINGGGEGSMANRHDDPLELPLDKPRGGTVRSSVKYTLKRTESNWDHSMRVLSNKRSFGRRNKPATRKKQFRRKYSAEYWREPEFILDDLSSLDCGSYSDNVEEQSTTEEAEKVEDIFSTPIPSDFVFNVNAPEFIPKGTNKKRKNIFTLSELLESLKGQQLPRMPRLDSS